MNQIRSLIVDEGVSVVLRDLETGGTTELVRDGPAAIDLFSEGF